ncbi:tetratricopeptide repeat protein [Tranquillimonas rosea]|uniref:tetratricopeptide repeat protein n=1 Tax=Tranquillimonas rosea TaxID=641238 RepID=UPI003BAD55F1
MVGSRHATSVTVGERLFTDREEPVALFKEALNRPQTSEEGDLDAYRVFVWYGVGGQGKTELRKELVRQIEALQVDGAAIALGVADFETPEHRTPLGGLLKLRASLGRGRRVTFPTFDFAYASWFANARPGADIRASHPELFYRGESEIVDDLTDWAADAAGIIAGVGAALAPGSGLIYKYGHRLTGRLRTWWDARDVKAKIAEIDALSEPDLLPRLPVYLGFDLWRATVAKDAPRVVVMLDTHEALWRDATRQSTLGADQWVRDFVEAAPGTLIAIFGRDKLRWGEIDPEWGTILNQHLLGGLSGQDADRFLETAGVPTEALRSRIVEGAEGLPFYLDLALDLFEDLTRSTGFLPTAEEFGRTPADVLDRFLRHLSDEEERELRLASYPAGLSESLFLDLCEAFPLGVAADWPRLSRRSFMTEAEGGRLEMHALMRQALQAREKTERPEAFTRVHTFLFERYDAQAQPGEARDVTPNHEFALAAASLHLRFAAPERHFSWLGTRIEVYRDAARWTLLDTLLGATDASTDEERGELLHNLAQARLELGHIEDAGTLFEQALDFKKVTVGSRHESCAVTLRELGRVREAMGRYKEAEELHEWALAVAGDSHGDRHEIYATILRSLAYVRQMMGRFDDVETLYLRALEINEATLGDRHVSYAATLNSLALLYHFEGRNNEAEAVYTRAIDIVGAAYGDRHPDYATTLHNLARVHMATESYDKAEELYRQALDITSEALGDRHPRCADTLHELATVRRIAGYPEDAESLYRQAQSISEASLGDGHPNSAAILHGIADTFLVRGRYAEAETLYKQALCLKEGVFGQRHPEFIVTLDACARVCEIMGRLEEAGTIFARVLALQEDTLHHRHPDLAETLLALADIRERAGCPEEADPLFMRALEITEDVVGDRHQSYAAILHNLARLRLVMGSDEEARALFGRAESIMKAALGEQHQETATTSLMLAVSCAAMGDFDAALIGSSRAIEVFRTTIGDDHPLYGRALYRRAAILERAGRIYEARSACRTALRILDAAPEADPVWVKDAVNLRESLASEI